MTIQFAWQPRGEIGLNLQARPTATKLPPEPGVYRLRFLDNEGVGRYCYVGQARNVDSRVGSDHIEGHRRGHRRLHDFITKTIEHGGTVKVDLLAVAELVTPNTEVDENGEENRTLEARMERELVRLAFEGLAAIKELDADGVELLNSEKPIPNDDLPPEIREVKGWWEAE